MPLYEYRCGGCDTTIEVLQKFEDDAPSCEICGRKLKKIISLSTFFLKDGGCGWGKNGYSKHKKTRKETKNVWQTKYSS